MISYFRGGSRIFSRGFQKTNRKFCRPFFLGRINFFSELSQSAKKTLFCLIFYAAGKILKKRAKKALLSTFWKILTKNSRFFREATIRSRRRFEPGDNSYQATIRKFLKVDT